MNLSEIVRAVPDFPKKGILFRDITTLLKNPAAFSECVNSISAHFINKKVDTVVAIESRGFIIGAPIALKLGAAFVPIRKPGKLPAETRKAEYALEYGKDCIEIHVDAIKNGDNVLIIDDLLATGGTVSAAKELVESLKGKIVGFAFLIELSELNGRDKLKDYEVFSLIKF